MNTNLIAAADVNSGMYLKIAEGKFAKILATEIRSGEKFILIDGFSQFRKLPAKIKVWDGK